MRLRVRDDKTLFRQPNRSTRSSSRLPKKKLLAAGIDLAGRGDMKRCSLRVVCAEGAGNRGGVKLLIVVCALEVQATHLRRPAHAKRNASPIYNRR